jgi:hypothetical protein
MKYFYLFILVFLPVLAHSQRMRISGNVREVGTDKIMTGAVVAIDGSPYTTYTDGNGDFSFELNESGEVRLRIESVDHEIQFLNVLPGNSQNLEIKVANSNNTGNAIPSQDLFPTITIAGADNSVEGADNTMSVLTASNDPFIAAMSFNFSNIRFRQRNVENENFLMFVNGVPVNDYESGFGGWSDWGGLNDVFRQRENNIGLSAIGFSFGGLVGGANFDTRASSQRKQARISYAETNRAFRHRIMATYSTGMMQNGWAFSFSGSRRWAQEGYVPGSFFDGWSYFGSVDKKIKKHLFNFTVFGASVKRGNVLTATQEMFDIAGSNFYNPGWGYQGGEKRNSAVTHTHQPTAILRHDYNTKNFSLTSALSFKGGPFGRSAFDWYNVADPRAEYYRYWPSFEDNGDQADELRNRKAADENARQVDWTKIYNTNRGNIETIENVNGIQGNNVTGVRSRYILQDRRQDSREFSGSSYFNQIVNDRISFQGGLNFQRVVNNNYNTVLDLLGGDFFVDIDQFAERDLAADPNALQNDIRTPNRILKQGDRYGHDFSSIIDRREFWGQFQYVGPKVDYFATLGFVSLSMQREGFNQNGRFPNNSLGKSPLLTFNTPNLKSGVTYKFNGRNYLGLNVMVGQRAPLFRNIYLSPRTRDQTPVDVIPETYFSAEMSYYVRLPKLTGRITAFGNRIIDQYNTFNFFLESQQSLVNYTLSGIDQQTVGLELGLNYKIRPNLTLKTAVYQAQGIYTSRPLATVTQDNNAEVSYTRTIYYKNFKLDNSPQSAYTAGFNYQGKKFWFANINFNYFDRLWLAPSPDRRTINAVEGIPVGSPQYNNIVDQTRAPGGFTADIFFGKSYKIGRDEFIYLNFSVNNIFNNVNIINFGFEQARFDYDTRNPNTFPPRFTHGFGINYFASVAYKF